MSGHQKWSHIRRAGNARLEEGFATTINAGLWLPELRRQVGLTQEQLAERLTVTQSWISQVENESDVRLSTLAAYIAAIGGELHLSATLPDGSAVDLTAPTPEDQAVVAPG